MEFNPNHMGNKSYIPKDGECMRGRIYADERCPVCGATLASKEPVGLYCRADENHFYYTGRCRVVFDNNSAWFDSYASAYKRLLKLRGSVEDGTYDARDYCSRRKPLSFSNLAKEWLEIKKKTLRPKAHQPVRNALEKVMAVWGETNIKNIHYADIEDFLGSLTLAPKTKKNTLDALKQFWSWAVDRYDIPPIKKWPKLGHIEMAFRKTVSIADQERILAKVKEQVGALRPRAWLAIKWLATYISVRPGEMVSITEGNIDRDRGLLIIPAALAKEGRPKIVQLLEEDHELLSQFPPEHPSMPFFRHDSGRYAGRQFGPQLLWKDWTLACEALGIDGVDLYGGTKHSTAMGLRAVATYEEVRKMTGHTTNKAFDRYLQLEGETMKDLYRRRKEIADLTSKLPASSFDADENQKHKYIQ